MALTTLWRRLRNPSLAALLLLALPVASCDPDGGSTDDVAPGTTVFEGARVITGGGRVIESGVVVVEGDRFVAVGASGEVDSPDGATRVDVAGRTVMPAIVNAHFHLDPEAEERARQLRHLAHYGVGAVVSLGHDTGDAAFAMRAAPGPAEARSMSAGRGITAPEPGRSEAPYWVETEAEARAAVGELAEREVDIVKIWVDDRGGRYPKLSPELYGPVIEEAHARGLKVTAHVYYLEDAKELLRAGVDVFAHGVRDLDADDELMALWDERPEVVLVPNLPSPGVPRGDLSWLGGTVSAEQIEQMENASAENPAAQAAFAIQARNLVRFHEAGVKIAFGTDGQSAWSAHEEMEDMVRAGMSPADVIVAATSASADLMGWDEVGLIEAGRSADFIVMEANPLDDIVNTRSIEAVYLRGTMINRERD